MISFLRTVSCLVLALTLSAGNASAQGFFDHPLTGKVAPDFTLDTLKAKAVKFSDLSKGKKAIVFFWATWCPHCRDQVKALKAQLPKLEKDGIVVVLVDIGEDRPVVENFLKAGNYDFEVFLDVDSYVAEMFQVFGVPTLFFIGADGKIREMLNVFPDDYAEILK
jgi:peroxiredoxin